MIQVVDLEQTCTACPSQWEGRSSDGHPIYIRYRHGHLSVRVGPVGGNIASAVEGREVFAQSMPDELDGYMNLNQLKAVTKDVLMFG